MLQNESTGEVWLSWRSKGCSDVRKIRLKTHTAHRYARKLHAVGHIDYLLIEIIVHPTVALAHGKAIAKAAAKNNTVKKERQELELRYERESFQAQRRRESVGRYRVKTQHMSFHLGRMEQQCIIFCQTTGIVGKLEMPYAPIVLDFDHPLAKAGNCLKLLAWYFSPIQRQVEVEYIKKEGKPKLDRQTLAGCLLSLLTAKNLLEKDARETTAVERNMVLQNAGHNVLSEILQNIAARWDNALVWNKVPRLSLDWNTHAADTFTVAGTLQSWLKRLKATTEPISFTDEDLAANRASRGLQQNNLRNRSRVKIHSASVVETRNIKEAKSTGLELFEQIAGHLPIADRISIRRVLKDLLLLPAEVKAKAAFRLQTFANSIAAKEFSLAVDAGSLAEIILTSSNEQLFKEAGSLMQEVSPKRIKSIAEILAEKKLAAQEQQNKVTGDSNE